MKKVYDPFLRVLVKRPGLPLRAVPAVSVPQWISVKDRLPEPDENPVIAGCEPLNVVFMAWYHSEAKRWELPSKIACEVTHWMPTSSLPRMDGAE